MEFDKKLWSFGHDIFQLYGDTAAPVVLTRIPIGLNPCLFGQQDQLLLLASLLFITLDRKHNIVRFKRIHSFQPLSAHLEIIFQSELRPAAHMDSSLTISKRVVSLAEIKGREAKPSEISLM